MYAHRERDYSRPPGWSHFPWYTYLPYKILICAVNQFSDRVVERRPRRSSLFEVVQAAADLSCIMLTKSPGRSISVKESSWSCRCVVTSSRAPRPSALSESLRSGSVAETSSSRDSWKCGFVVVLRDAVDLGKRSGEVEKKVVLDLPRVQISVHQQFRAGVQ